MFTKRTTLIGAALALGAAAFAAPAQAAGSNGADVTKFNECTVYGSYQDCRTGTALTHQVSTRSGIQSTSSASNYTDTLTATNGGTVLTAIRTQTHSHTLVRDGQLIERGQHYREQTTDGSRQCWEREDSHQTGDKVQYDREAHHCH
ncbi:hypothetical protein LFT44_04300 [Arthrobacter sp. FW306-05-C]|uniref:hypothetical protein n=1 Tax=unclassified Arthrobacter TaxID=235627 RepID=UPI001EF0606E|nr:MULTISPECIES: hypothetical protein [unclassified Arthrobacter]UKA67645.1 hypothetical protein LFT44_04300 [Arthrobacter sp. FW306-05-C]UKA72122.1 hypothetical protein LFT49_05165 [Arthrobacter sp. FW306-06-A]